jgi:hypothetical protein
MATKTKKPGTRDADGNLIVPIEIQSWEDELVAEEPEITDLDSVIELRKKLPGGKVARLIGAAQARGDIERLTTRMDRLLYQSGIEVDINEQVTSKMETARLANGREIQIRSVVGTVSSRDMDAEDDGDPEDESYGLLVDALSEAGLERAIRYFHRSVPGYIMGRLEIIAAHDGDVRGHAEWLIGRIWEMVTELNGETIAVVKSS